MFHPTQLAYHGSGYFSSLLAEVVEMGSGVTWEPHTFASGFLGGYYCWHMLQNSLLLKYVIACVWRPPRILHLGHVAQFKIMGTQGNSQIEGAGALQYLKASKITFRFLSYRMGSPKNWFSVDDAGSVSCTRAIYVGSEAFLSSWLLRQLLSRIEDKINQTKLGKQSHLTFIH